MDKGSNNVTWEVQNTKKKKQGKLIKKKTEIKKEEPIKITSTFQTHSLEK